MPWRRRRSACDSDVSPSGTSIQRYIVAAPPASRSPLRAATSSSSARFRAYASRARSRAPRHPRRRPTRAVRTPAGRYRVRPEPAQRGDQLRVSRDEAAPEARHRGALRERVEHDDVRPVVELQGRGGGSSNQSSVYASSEASTKPCARASPREPSRRSSDATAPVGLFGVFSQTSAARPQTSSAHLVEVGEEPVLLEERELDDPCAGERGAATGHGIAGLRHDDRVAPPARSSTTCAKEKIASFEPRVGMTWRPGSRVDARTGGSTQRGDRLAQLRQPRGGRIAHPLSDAVTQRLEDRRVGRLPGVAHPEVDNVVSRGAPRGRCLVEADERIRLLRPERRGERHAPDASRTPRARGREAPRTRARALRRRRARRGGGRSASLRGRS